MFFLNPPRQGCVHVWQTQPPALEESRRDSRFVNAETLDWNAPGSLRALTARVPLQTSPAHSGCATEGEALQKELSWPREQRSERSLWAEESLGMGLRGGSTHLSEAAGASVPARLGSGGWKRGCCPPCGAASSCSQAPPRQLGTRMCSEKWFTRYTILGK